MPLFIVSILNANSADKLADANIFDNSIRIYMGYDDRFPNGYHVCQHSIIEYSTKPVAITLLRLSNIKKNFWREKDLSQLSDFSYSRFIVPALCNYQGWSLFIDGTDMMLRDDIAKLWALRDDRFAVMVVKHPTYDRTHSFANRKLQAYPMFNWSSVMLFNNVKCKKLTPQYVNTADYYDLHQFKWLDEGLIGALDPTWNHLVGYYQPNPDAKLIHWTFGAPYQGEEYANTEHAHEWHETFKKLVSIS